jgi:hypothetical protein
VAALQALAGGTLVLDKMQPPPQVPATPLAPVDDDEPRSRPPRYASLWQGKSRLVVIAAGATIVVGLVSAVALVGSTRHQNPGEAMQTTPTTPAPATVREEPAGTQRAGPPPPARAAETVRIDLQGIPSGAEVTVDGQPAGLLLRVPRDGRKHRLVSRGTDGVERSFDIDADRDRVIDLLHGKEPAIVPPERRPPSLAEPTPAPAPAPAPAELAPPHPRKQEATLRKPPAVRTDTGASKKRPPISKDREAITDL